MLKKPIIRTVGAIALGAIGGALSRYYLGQSISHIVGSDLPYSTLIVNVSGCLLMGFLTTLFLGQIIRIHPDIQLLALTGFLGSYTTFSSYELDSALLLQHHRLRAEVFYWGGSTLLGLLSLELGILSAEWVLRTWNHQHFR